MKTFSLLLVLMILSLNAKSQNATEIVKKLTIKKEGHQAVEK